MASKYVDTAAIMQVIGCIYKDPEILDKEDRYVITEDDFVEEFHKIVFGVIYKLHSLGASKVTQESIVDFLETRPKSKGIFDSNKGLEYIQKVQSIASLMTFDYYYNRVKKMSLLRAYDTIGLDVTEFYNPDNILDLKKKQVQEEWLDNVSLETIADKIDEKIETIRQDYVDNDVFGQAIKAGDGIKELIIRLEKQPDIGVPLYGNYINTITRGARLGKFYLRSAPSGVGKSLPNSTVIPTPNGYKTVGEIKVNDYLFDAFGKPTKVLAIYPQGKKQIWEIEFKDGRKAQCCEEHLWSYCSEGQRETSKQKRQFYTNTVKELSKKVLYKQGRGYQILVPMQKAVQYPHKEYSIHPYILGLFLGDGSFRYSKTNKSLMFSSTDIELINFIEKYTGWRGKQYVNHSKYSWYFEDVNNLNHTKVWVEDFLKAYPELWNLRSEDKFIPKDFLQGDIEQRFDLLNGLLDTDGTAAQEKGRVSYYTVSSKLRDNVIELARSLGFKTSWFEDNHKDTLPCYCIEIFGTAEDKLKLFKLTRKKEIIKAWYNNGKRKENNLFNPIVKIIPTDNYEEMTCFYVDNDEHLFLMNDFIVTHNTRSMIADACYIGCGRYYDEQFGWISNGKAFPTLFVGTEQDKDEIQTMMLAFLSNVNEEHILLGKYDDGERDRVFEAATVIENSPLYIEELPEFNLQDVENVIKRNIRDNHVQYIFHDYIHTSLKILEEISKKAGKIALREDNVLFMLSARLKEICVKYGVFLMSATQLNGDYQDAKTPDQNLLRGAKAIADKIDYGAILLPVKENDLASLEPVIAKNPGWTGPNIKLSVYKNRRGRYKSVLLWCKADLSTCRINPMFMTDYQYELQSIEDIKIQFAEEESAF